MSGDFTIKDRHGNNLHFGHGGDIYLPQYEDIDDYREHLKTIRHMELRNDDVIQVGYPRSGTHWHNQILHMLMQNTSDYVGNLNDDLIDWKPPHKFHPPDNPRVLVSYLRFHHMPLQALEKEGVKMVYSYRNPKDSWASYYTTASGMDAFNSAYKGTWHQFFDLMTDIGYWYGDWFDHVLDWEKAAAEYPDVVFLSCFELMKKDPVGQIQKLDQFLGLNRGRELCEKIADACNFKKLKAGRQKKENMGELWKKGADGMYRKGEIGDWKTWFTVAQDEKFNAIFQKRMKGSKLTMIYV